MSNERTRPNALQYIAYSYGYVLPPAMEEWVKQDLAGKGAASRMVIRASVLCVLILIPFLFIPTSLYVHVSMTLPILIPFVYFAVALNRVYRRHRLSQHGLDPALADVLLRAREADERNAYLARHGRSTDA